MKKAFLILFLFICAEAILCTSVQAQDCNADFLGTKTLYKDPHQKYTPPPAGYLPVFINHVGRHGARHLTKDVKTTSAYALLMKADSLNALTEKGKLLKQMAIALQKIEKGNTKNISAEGKDELKGLGERMITNFANVFKGVNELNVAVTKEVRTEQSADAFLTGLKSKLKDSVKVTKFTDDVNLRFYDLSPGYKKYEGAVDEGNIMLTLQRVNHMDDLNTGFVARFFKVDFLSKINANVKSKFTDDVFGFATIVYSLKQEIEERGFKLADVDFKSLFTCDELSRLGFINSVDENLKKGPGTNNNGIQVKVAVPLLVNFIATADGFIKSGKAADADLRFAHAETIAPFAVLLQIADASKASPKPAMLGKSWQASNVIPLSSNIQWIFYKKKYSAGYLVKVLLNERESHITGLDPKAFPYYKWSDLRKLYMNKLTKMGVYLTDDMNAFLESLK